MASPGLKSQDAYLQPPPPYRPPSQTSFHSGSASPPGPMPGSISAFADDPRSASTQSLAPSTVDVETGSGSVRRRRILLLIYIHGFYGNAQSFQSFPYHVHEFLKDALAETHAVHTKIYPRYKCYRAMEVARDNFSAWLRPHESPHTDVILIGHSMGGLVAADVVLKPNQNPYNSHPLQHRILGTLSLDTPFLGLHPGIIASGLASLFAPQEDSAGDASSPGTGNAQPTPTDLSPMDSQSLLSAVSSNSIPPSDPSYNPHFFNDNEFREQSFFSRLGNFAQKHRSEGLYRALRNHVVSHLEYAGAMADYPALNKRYNKIRALEDVDQIRALTESHAQNAPSRVRFLNYYTISPGRPKKSKSSLSNTDANTDEALRSGDIPASILSGGTPGASESDLNLISPSLSPSSKPPDTPAGTFGLRDVKGISAEDDSHPTTELKSSPDEPHHSPDPPSEQPDIHTSQALPERPSEQQATETTLASATQTGLDQIEADLPPIPEPPTPPVLPDLGLYTDKDMRKQAEKESRRLQRNYENALKDREKALREREKLLQKRRKKADKEAQKEQQRESKDQQRRQKEQDKDRLETQQAPSQTELELHLEQASIADTASSAPRSVEGDKPKKLRKFCTIPRSRNGYSDPTWVDIYMDGMDEVSAHTSLFFPGPHYDRLVGDVSSRILQWIEDDLSVRAVVESMDYSIQ
ncbi:hypothetical protein B0I35DRAFT_244919 [Stachybotrys elegans]|uniref:DUF676 domain-containing protein n=1 Tax=Stachybotrys elegans TaxID=80388 RepID=A0A8K0SQ47_9HYPO|nr:hypothetical protein B0I35DRAFT_244919 [Stachybotrys elegans]